VLEKLEGFPDNVAAYRCGGQLTFEEYRAIVADLEDRYTRHAKLRSYTEVTDDFHGVEPHALWEDAKLGIAHFFDWDRFAVVTNQDWITRWTKLMTLFVPMQGRTFPSAQAAEARAWISEPPVADARR